MTPAASADRFASRPVRDGGTPLQVWKSRPPEFPELDVVACPHLVVVAPHPDDETLGLGATIATLGERGVPVDVVSVSDGGAAFGHLDDDDRAELEAARRSELSTSLEILGASEPLRLGMPDGGLADFELQITEVLAAMLVERPPGTWCAATWRGDGHPDHEAVGRAAAAAARHTGAVLLEYPVWMWHWAIPDDPAVPWRRGHRLTTGAAALGRKAAAAMCFGSQLGAGPDGTDPVIPDFALERLIAMGEVVFR